MAITSHHAVPWVEKYRPKSLEDVSHQTEVVSTLQNAVRTNRLPHLLFYGPPGTGKTSVALALCRTLWHPNELNRRVLELNASDERGISIVRDKIKNFASLAVSTASVQMSKPSVSLSAMSLKGSFFKRNSEKREDAKKDIQNDNKYMETSNINPGTKECNVYPSPPFKIIILDEADTVTRDAQAALRRIIEAHSKITRFILICNYVTRIIEPLASRCAKFRFQPLPPCSMSARLTTIARAENCLFSLGNLETEEKEESEALDEILNLSGGDMRRAVTILQSAQSLSSGSSETFGIDEGIIRKKDIAEMAGLPPPRIIESLIDTLKDPSSNFEKMEKIVTDILLEGYSTQYIIGALFNKIKLMDEEELTDGKKAEIVIKMAEVDKCLTDGADNLLQLLTVCSLILRCFK